MAPNPAGNRDLALEQQAEAPAPQLALSSLDQAAVAAFMGGDSGEVAELVEDARKMAAALAGDDGDGARVRLLSRATAEARTQQRVLEVVLGDRLAKRDVQGVELVNKTLDGVTKRLTALLKQLAMESALAKRPSVYVAHADEVNLRDRR
jgi:hypothetical protein